MFICECGRIFDIDEARTVRECVGEFWGAPAYERWLACPRCKSTDIEEYTLPPCCENCVHIYTEYGCDLCSVHGITLENSETEYCEDYEEYK